MRYIGDVKNPRSSVRSLAFLLQILPSTAHKILHRKIKFLLQILPSTARKILHRKMKFRAYKIHIGKYLQVADYAVWSGILSLPGLVLFLTSPISLNLFTHLLIAFLCDGHQFNSKQNIFCASTIDPDSWIFLWILLFPPQTPSCKQALNDDVIKS